MIEGEERAKPAPADENSAVSFKLFNTASATWKIGVALGDMIFLLKKFRTHLHLKRVLGQIVSWEVKRVLKQNLGVHKNIDPARF